MIAVYYRRTSQGEEKYHDVTDYIEPGSLPEFRASLDNDLPEFFIKLIDPVDSEDEYIVPSSGDDIVICTDTTRTSVFKNMAGRIFKWKDSDYTYLESSETSVVYEISFRTRDFSQEYIDIEVVNYTFEALLDLILENNVKGFLGGSLPSGAIISKYTNNYSNPTLETFKYSGKPYLAVKQACETLGIHCKIKHFVEPDTTKTLTVLQSLSFFDESGDNEISEIWQTGINNQILQEGRIPNPFYLNPTDTPDEPEYIATEALFVPEGDSDPVKNYLRLTAYVFTDETAVQFKKISQKGDQTTFEVDYASDILYVARHLLGKIESVAADDEFNIDVDTASAILYDDTRLTNNNLDGQLTCLITLSNVEYVRNYTISGQTITLASDVTGLDTSAKFEHVNGYDILKEAQESYPGDGNGYVKKYIKHGEKAKIEFTDYDKPVETEEIIVGYKKLEPRKIPQIYNESIDLHDMQIITEEIDFPLTLEQYNILCDLYRKFTVEKITLNIESYRQSLEPEFGIIEPGWSIPINLVNRRTIQGNFIVNDVSGVVISPINPFYEYLPIIKQNIVCTSYRDNLEDILKKFKQQNNLTDPKYYENPIIKRVHYFELIHQKLSGFLIDVITAPSLNTPTNLQTTGFTVTWGSVTGAVSYTVQISENSLFTTYTEYSGITATQKIFTGLTTDTTYYVRAFAYGYETSSGESNTVAATTIYNPYSAKAYYLFDGNANDGSENLYHATLEGSASTTSGDLVLGNNATDYLNIPAAVISSEAELTFCGWVKIDTLHTSGSFPSNCLIMCGNLTYSNLLALYYEAGSNRWVYRCNDSTDVYFSSSTIEDLGWHFILFELKTGSGSYAKLYIDDMATEIANRSNALASVNPTFFILGQESDSTTGSPGSFSSVQSWAGKIDAFYIFDRILSTADKNAVKALATD